MPDARPEGENVATAKSSIDRPQTREVSFLQPVPALSVPGTIPLDDIPQRLVLFLDLLAHGLNKVTHGGVLQVISPRLMLISTHPYELPPYQWVDQPVYEFCTNEGIELLISLP